MCSAVFPFFSGSFCVVNIYFIPVYCQDLEEKKIVEGKFDDVNTKKIIATDEKSVGFLGDNTLNRVKWKRRLSCEGLLDDNHTFNGAMVFSLSIFDATSSFSLYVCTSTIHLQHDVCFR